MAPKKLSKTQTALKLIADELERLERQPITDELLVQGFDELEAARSAALEARDEFSTDLDSIMYKFEESLDKAIALISKCRSSAPSSESTCSRLRCPGDPPPKFPDSQPVLPE